MLAGYGDDQRRRGLAGSTIEQRHIALTAFARWLFPAALTDATTADVEAFLAGREPITARTRTWWLSTLTGFYSYLTRTGRRDTNPAAQIPRPRRRRTLPRPVSDDDLHHALAQADGHMRVWVTLAAYAGLRVGEIAALESSDVCWPEGLLRVCGKGGHERMVPMHPQVAAELRRWGVPARGPLFARDGRAWTAAMVSRRMSAYLRSVGVDATAHQLRHWFGSSTYRVSRDLRVVQELLGHESPQTTAIYTSWSPATALEAVLGL